MALQVGGALGVAVIGSVLATRYQDHMSAALAGRHVPAAAADTILGSLGGALAVAAHAGGAAVALCGAVLVIALLPAQVPRDLTDPSVPAPEKQAPSAAGPKASARNVDGFRVLPPPDTPTPGTSPAPS